MPEEFQLHVITKVKLNRNVGLLDRSALPTCQHFNLQRASVAPRNPRIDRFEKCWMDLISFIHGNIVSGH
jgi:hypothetical protein